MRKARQDVEIFSLSFLDCICCGFGAIVLLLVLARTSEPIVIDAIQEDPAGVIERLERELADMIGQSRVFEQQIETRRESTAAALERVEAMKGEKSKVEGQFAASEQDAEVQNKLRGAMAKAEQELTAEMRRLQAKQRIQGTSQVGGIPVDSEYIIFIIDTSGSMQRFSWSLVQQKVAETLEVYPTVKGIQVMNDMGQYMFSSYQRRWIPDSTARRRAILKTLRNWSPFSNSSPVEGIAEAIRTFHKSDRKISLYVFGDEFSGASIASAVAAVDSLNRKGSSGDRLVRIHGVGFPLMDRSGALSATGTRFATLMRILAERNGGAFVGL
jgi:hypothetical protein